MSLVTTQPEMLTATPSASTALLAGGISGHPSDGAARDGNRRIERRRNGGSYGSPMEILSRLPAVVVLERFPIPSLAMTRTASSCLRIRPLQRWWVTSRTA
jgi:hypothetical protein